MEIQYTLPPVDLTKQDIEWLEREILDLFNDPEPAFKSFQVSVTVGKGSDKIELEETKVERLLQSAFLRKMVNRLHFSYTARYGEPSNEVRGLTLTFEANSRTQVRLQGTEAWVHSARDRISTYLEGKANHNLWLRRGAFFLIWLVPTAGFFFLASVRPLVINNTSVFAVASVFWGLAGPIFSSSVSEKMYPLSTVTLGTQVQRPWYTAFGSSTIGCLDHCRRWGDISHSTFSLKTSHHIAPFRFCLLDS